MATLKTVALWSLSTLLALLFLAVGAWKFLDPSVAGQFAAWGYPDWLRTLIGIVEIGGGIILLFPSVAWEGAAILAVVMTGAVFTLVRSGEATQAVVPAVLLGLVILVGFLRHPRYSLVQRLRAASDWVAEREIAEQQRWLASSKH
jgi:uncharacterized membrane protein YphA (DoxX/SURF4 family)